MSSPPVDSPVRSGGLGRGLSSLLAISPQGFSQISIATVRPNPRQPRKTFDPEKIEMLAESIRRFGVLQPVLVRKDGDQFELVAGERRLRAAQIAGLTTIPAVVKEVTDSDSLEQALIENVQRHDLNALEEAAAFNQLIEDFGLTHAEVGRSVGRSRTAVTNTLRLLALPVRLQEMLVSESITAGHARALVAIEDPDEQVALALRTVSQGLSVRQVEALVAQRSGGEVDDSGRSPDRNSAQTALFDISEVLGEYLNTSVFIKAGRGSGKMIVEFASLDDLERIAEMIIRAPGP